MWRELSLTLEQAWSAIEQFLTPWLSTRQALVLLTGAGSSAFIGEVLADEANRNWPCEVRAVATTSLLTHPHAHLQADRPTLLLSFARSGNSPESSAAVALVRALVRQSGFVNITCNPEGALYREGLGRDDTLNLLMPKGSCDQGFAMTSSFSCMLLAAQLILSPLPWTDQQQALAMAATQAASVLSTTAQAVAHLAHWAQSSSPRLVVLGDGPMLGLAREAALKMLELTAGGVVALCDTTLGFRHGPKAVLHANTLVLVLSSGQPDVRRYQQDLVNELRRDGVAGKVIVVGPQLADHPPVDIPLPGLPHGELWQGLLALLVAQALALHSAVALGCTPDNPFPEGRVNRVVQGVTIYPMAQA
ncbi:tagatose-6-phosphate ketose isomerase [Roseateles sp. BYS180W]|uniref:Tagatose-6-phosphate ketose isomerase n=1 Tax=Roseateles rivi TaxID=3299028 RepID=A0ABW7FV12_9BURK